MIHDTKPAVSGGGRRGRLGLSLLIAALALFVLPGAAEAKRDKIGVATFNLYLGSDLADATAAAQASRTDLFADEVGEVFRDIYSNDFNTRAKNIAQMIKKKKVDLIGLQEVALWKAQVPTDASGLNPAAQRATTPIIDYLDTLLDQLNKKAKSKEECREDRQEAKLTPSKKDDPKAARCYRGYKTLVVTREADIEFLGDFDNNPGPDGRTCDLSSGTCPAPPAPDWTFGNDDTGVSLGEPPTPQCVDGRDNDGDGFTDFTGGDPGCPAGAGIPSAVDNSEAQPGIQPSLPQDANFDSHALATAPNGPFDGLGNGRDPAGVTDCPDNKATGNGGGPFAGSVWANGFVNVCLFHGIDGDLSLEMRDVILKRKGEGVRTSNEKQQNFSNQFRLPLFGGQANVTFTRGWNSVDANVRGKKFTFVNTHLESESFGTVREDQAAELIAPDGPASVPSAVLVGDLNSDPNRPPTNLPHNDGGSSIAINRLLNNGFRSLAWRDGLATASHGDHGDIINDESDVIGEGWIDHILTNDPNIEAKGRAKYLDKFRDGLWSSDHAGLFVRILGKKD